MPRAGAATLILLCLLVYLPGFFGVPPTDAESRWAQGSRQVFEFLTFAPTHRDPARHSAIIPRIADQTQTGSPPLPFWLRAASAAALSGGNPYRDAIFMYRLPSLLAAILLVLIVRRLATELFDPSAGRLAAAFIALCPLALWHARQATPAMLTAAASAWAMLLLWRAAAPSDATTFLTRRSAAVFWILLALATLSGGLLSLLIIVATIATCAMLIGRKVLIELRPLMGIPILAVSLGAYFAAALQHVDASTLLSAWTAHLLWNDSDQFLPPGTYLATLPVTAWPGVLLAPAGLLLVWKLGRGRSAGTIHPGYAFLLAWIAPLWVLLEAAPGKTSGLALLLATPLSIIGARALLAASAGALPDLESRLTSIGKTTWLIAGAAIAFTAISLFLLRLLFWPGTTAAAIGAGLVSFLGALLLFRSLAAAWRSILKGLHARAAIAGVGTMLVIALLVPTVVLPRFLGLSRDLAAALERIDPSGSRPIAAMGFQSPSLVFLTRARIQSPADITSWHAANPSALLIRDNAESDAQPLATVTGFDASLGKPRRLDIVEAPR